MGKFGSVKPLLGTPLDRGHPLSRGLVGCWPVNDKPPVLGILHDVSGNNNHGTLVGDVSTAIGKFGSSLYFPGVTDYVTVPDNGTLRFNSATQDFSIVLWINTANAGTQYVIGKLEANDDGWRVLTTVGVVWLSVGTVDVKGAANIADGRWHQIVAVANRSGNGQIYIDGVANGNPVSVSGLAMDTASPVIIGTSPYATNTNEYVGLMDNVSIYNRVVSASEVQQLYIDPFQMFYKQGIELFSAAGETTTTTSTTTSTTSTTTTTTT
ncbi:MAG: LamG domain-containing protein, partial [Planctomycetes bacterium]|nr:LamG domain-containing protein [Planctomycetota bacterium]